MIFQEVLIDIARETEKHLKKTLDSQVWHIVVESGFIVFGFWGFFYIISQFIRCIVIWTQELNLRKDSILNYWVKSALLQLHFPFELYPMNAILHENLTAALSMVNISQTFVICDCHSPSDYIKFISRNMLSSTQLPRQSVSENAPLRWANKRGPCSVLFCYGVLAVCHPIPAVWCYIVSESCLPF